VINVIARWVKDNLSSAEIDQSHSVVFGWAHNQARSLSEASAKRMLLATLRKAHFAALTKSNAVDAEDDGMASLTALAADLDMDRRRLTSFISALGVVGGERRGKRRVSFDPVQVAEIRREIDALLTRVEVGEPLGIRSWEVSPLLSAGYLTPIAYVSGDAGRGMKFLRRKVDDILRSISILPRVSVGPSRKFRAYCRAERRPVGDVAVAIIKREISVRRIDGRTGFRGIHIALDGGYRAAKRDQSVISDYEERSE
jgi:hypothetical protein